MKNGSYSSTALLSCFRIAGLALTMGAAAQGAQFQFGALVQAGVAGTGDWEIGIGTTATAPSSTASLGTHWADGVSRMVEMEYLKPTNTVNVRVYNGNTATGAFTQASYNPAGGAAVGANAIWTLPASSFFVQALGTIQPISITVSNITLTGISGALNVIQPIQQTTLAASHGLFGGTDITAQSGDVVFQSTGSGSWRMAASVTMTGFLVLPSGNQTALGINASAVDAVPEPSTFALLLVGGALVAGGRLRKSKTASRA